MRHLWFVRAMMVFVVLPLTALHAQSKEETSSVKVEATKTETPKPEQFKPEQQQTKGTVTIGGKTIDYDAYAGTLIVHPKDWDDVPEFARETGTGIGTSDIRKEPDTTERNWA